MADDNTCERAADGLCEVTLQMEEGDLNALMDDDVREFLNAKETVENMTLRYRRNQHAIEENTEDSA